MPLATKKMEKKMEISWTSSDLNPVKLELIKGQIASWKLRNTFLINSYQRRNQNYLESKVRRTFNAKYT